MNKIISRTPAPQNPVMLDRALLYIQEELIHKIGWLDYAFGKVQRLATMKEHRICHYPGAYIGNGEYLNVLPGHGYGNISFFSVSDPYTIDFVPRRYNTVKAPVSLILWYDLTTIYKSVKERNTEEIKSQVLRILSNVTMPDGSSLALSRIFEHSENIFSGFSIQEVDTQYLMQPYAGIRFDGTITYREECR